MDGLDLTVIQMDLIQMDDYPTDSCGVSPTAFLLEHLLTLTSGPMSVDMYPLLCMPDKNRIGLSGDNVQAYFVN